VQLYKRKHGQETSDIVCDLPLSLKEWPHPAKQVTIIETSDTMTYPIGIYTDGSKDASMVGAGTTIYSNKQLIKQCKYKLCSYYQTNKAEQVAIFKALEQLHEMETPTGGKAEIYTDSKASTDFLKNHAVHRFLIEKIRNIRQLTMQNWTINFGWVKEHDGIEGNEAADKLAKQAAKEDENLNFVFDRIPTANTNHEN